MSDRQEHADDKYARESFTVRTMKRWQLWGITVAATALVAAMLIYNGA